MESELFTGILEAAAAEMTPQEGYELLLALSRTGRFDMNVMMATDADHAAVDKIGAGMLEAGMTEQDCFMLRKRYGL